jgi:hypothetical protein
MGGVQSSGEKLAFRRTIGRFCQSGVRSSNEKSLLFVGLIAREITRRMHGFGQGGGESGIRTHGTEGRILGPSSDYLLRNDWLSSLIGALLLTTWNG